MRPPVIVGHVVTVDILVVLPCKWALGTREVLNVAIMN